MSHVQILVGMSLVAVTLLGCQANKGSAPAGRAGSPPLAGTYWVLTSLGDAAVEPSKAGREPHLQFGKTDGRIAGSGGVNRLMGGYKLQGEQITITPGGMTMMAGPEPLMRQEQAFAKALSEARAYRIDGRTLELLNGATVVARFEARTKP